MNWALDSDHDDHDVSVLLAWLDADDASATEAPAVTPQPPTRCNASRQRRHHDVQALREQARALEEHLTQVQQRPTEEIDDGTLIRRAMWKAIAKYERSQRQAAEEKRTRLRGFIREYRLAIKRSQRLIRQHPFPASVLGSVLMDSDDDGFCDIARALPAMYLQVDGVFRDPRFHGASHVRDVRVQNDATPHMSIEALASRLVPFSVQATADAVWRFQQIKTHEVATAINERADDAEDTLRRTVTVVVDIPKHTCKFRGRFETRRFQEPNRVVILESSVFDRTERIAGTAPEGYALRQFTWTVVGPPRDARLRASEHAIAQIETFEVTIPETETLRFDGLSTSECDSLKSFIVDATTFIQDTERQTIENLLVAGGGNGDR